MRTPPDAAEWLERTRGSSKATSLSRLRKKPDGRKRLLPRVCARDSDRFPNQSEPRPSGSGGPTQILLIVMANRGFGCDPPLPDGRGSDWLLATRSLLCDR